MQKKPLQSPSGTERRGFALIIVLAAVILLTVLILAFLTGISSELRSSKMYANGSSVKLLSQSAVALVTGEIQAATADPTLCWASQPGMIRTYDTTGAPHAYYKLYSDDGMYGAGAFNATLAANLVPSHLYSSGGATDWYNQKGVYVDLNQPVYVNGANYYPILDGNPTDYSSSQYPNSVYTAKLSLLTVPTPASSTVETLTPLTSSLPAVTGFWLDANTPVNSASSASPDAAPMPVKWLYVLKNGEVIVPDSNSSGGAVTFDNDTPTQPQPKASDPIVGRMAFWTDDETCKVNINTASDGANANGSDGNVYNYNTTSGVTAGVVDPGSKSTFWDTPRTDTPQDFAYAYSQPVQNEFQRYPGHPATVALSAVFNSFTGDANFPEFSYSLGTTTPSIAPRVSRGGSVEGTVATSGSGNGATSIIGTGTLSQLGYRFYSTPDELLFQPTLSGAPGKATRALNSSVYPELTPALLEQAKFFITANSEAPDVNLFNLPRVSMWPITLNQTTGVAELTPYDQLLSFCSTLNGSLYYFQRQDPTSSRTDLPLGDTTATGRNRQLLEYLRTLTSQPIPGFGGTFSGSSGKYTTSDFNQTLVEMFDYVRCTNLQDSSTGATAYAQAYDNSGTATDYLYGGGSGQVVPIVDANTTVTDTLGGKSQPRGFGRFPTIQQAALMFIGAGDNATDGSVSTLNPNPPTSFTPQVAPGMQRVQAGFFLQMFDPSQGIPIERPWYAIKVSGLNNLTWNSGGGAVPIFPTTATFPYLYNTNGIYLQPTAVGINFQTLFGLPGGKGYSGFTYGGIIDWRQQSLMRGNITGVAPNYSTSKGKLGLPLYPYISPPTGQTGTAPDMASGKTFAFGSAGDVVVQIYALSATGTQTLVQTVNLNFPATNLPVPYSIDNNIVLAAPTFNKPPYTTPTYGNGNLLPGGSASSAASFLPSTITQPNLYNFLSFLDSYQGGIQNGLSPVMARLDWGSEQLAMTVCDTLRAIVATPGDMRLVAARQTVPDSMYQPITSTAANLIPAGADYYNPSNFFSHMLRYAFGAPVYGAIGGKLIVGTSAPATYKNQYIPAGTFGDSTYTGSYINPADNDVPNQAKSVVMGGAGLVPGDWDTGLANTRDGAYINKPDEGDAGNAAIALSTPSDQNTSPYFELNYGTALPGATFFSPNRMIPSPGMFGSLPSGVWSNQPWQTLLFRPGPAGHVGLGTSISGSGDSGPPYTKPPDHLLMDLFTMPVVEPYAISTPLATAGRINMNYQIVPFTYINRDTGLRAVLKNQMMAVIPTSVQATYKSSGNASGSAPSLTKTPNTRYPINLDATLSQFMARFYNTTGTQGATGTPDIFRSASEICDIDLVPLGAPGVPSTPITRSAMDAFWVTNGLTGDNVRERPYTNIYPLLTTKSNTFTVHYRVQTLKQTWAPGTPSSSYQSWREGTDVVLAEYRGSQTIERYLDLTNANIADYAGVVSSTGALPSASQALSQYYKFRVVSTKQFPP